MGRDKIEVIIEVLERCIDEPELARSRLLGGLGLTGTNSKIAKILEGCGLVNLTPKSKGKGSRYSVTAKGLDWLERAKALLSEISLEIDQK